MRLARIFAVVATLLSLALASRLRLSRDLTELFPRTAEADALARVTRVFGGGDVGMLLVRGDDPAEVERASDDAAAALAACPAVAHVVKGSPAPKPLEPTAAWRFAGPAARDRLARALTEDGMRRRLRDTRAMLLAPGASEATEWLARDPLRLAMIPWEDKLEVAPSARATAGGAFVADDGRARLLLVEGHGHVFEGGEAARFVDETERALAPVRRAHPSAKIEQTGGHMIAKQTESMMRTDMEKSSVLSVVLASLVFVLTFRRPRALVAVLPPLAAGTLWTTALAYLAYPRLSAIATAFAAVVVGVGVDTGVHVYGRLLAARREGLSPAEAARAARHHTWKPTLGAAVAAGGAFACLALSDVEGMRQLGVLCAVGEVLTAIAILIAVPEVGAWLERGPPPPALRFAWADAVTRTRPRALLALAAASALVATAAAFGPPRLSSAVAGFDARMLPALATYDAIYATFGGTRGQLLVVSSDPDEQTARAHADVVAETAEQLARQGVISGYDALGMLAPSLAAQRMRLAARDAIVVPAKSAMLARVLREEGFAEEAFAPALEALRHPTEEVSDVGPLEGGATAWLRQRHVGHDARGAIVVTYVRLTGDRARDEEARAMLRAADPSAVITGFADLESGLRASLVRDLPRVLAAALGVVIFVLAGALRRPGAVALAVVVLAVEIALVLVASRALGVGWHVYDALVLPVLLGITLDEALFLLEASAQRPIGEALAEQAPLATSTALTTAAGFAALVVCRFGGLVDVGTVGALGSTAGLVCALVVIPAGLRLARDR